MLGKKRAGGALPWISVVLLVVLAGLTGLLWYDHIRNRLVETAVNVTHVEHAGDVVSASLHSDFYYRITYFRGGEKVGEVSSLVPVVTELGYRLEDLGPEESQLPPPRVMRRQIAYDAKHQFLDAGVEGKLAEDIEIFAERYGELVLARMPAVVEYAEQRGKDLVERVTGRDFELPRFAGLSPAFETLEFELIPNLTLRYLAPDKVDLRRVAVVEDAWHPDIVHWEFNEDDSIYLQLLGRFPNADLSEHFENQTRKARDRQIDAAFIRTASPLVGGRVQPFFIEVQSGSREATALYMDDNGYTYLLRLRTATSQAFSRAFPDFLKIAFGVALEAEVDRNPFSLMQKRYEENMSALLDGDVLAEIETLQVKLGKYGLLEHFGVSAIDLSDGLEKRIEHVLFSPRFAIFRETFGDYPTDELTESLNETLADLRLIDEALEASKKGVYGFREYDLDALKQDCTSLDCVRKRVGANKS